MRLLVSVRSAEETAAAVAGGADILDAKEPAGGSLGPVAPAELGRIARALPPFLPLSVALGDLRRPDLAATAVRDAAYAVGGRSAPLYLKLGVAGATGQEVNAVLAAAVAAADAVGVGVVAAAYADHEAAGAIGPRDVLAAAARQGAAAVLVDTWCKDGRDLFDWLPPPALGRWVAAAHAAGMLAAVAGSLRPTRLGLLRDCGADVVGVRGAVCKGGRTGRVGEELVALAKRALRGTVESAGIVAR